MPEHDEPDAPAVEEELADEDEFWADVEAIETRRKPKRDRWGVEDKVVETETK